MGTPKNSFRPALFDKYFINVRYCTEAFILKIKDDTIKFDDLLKKIDNVKEYL